MIRGGCVLCAGIWAVGGTMGNKYDLSWNSNCMGYGWYSEAICSSDDKSSS